MPRNFLFDLDQTLLNFHASEYKALGIVLRENGLEFNDDIYNDFKTCNKSLWLELEKSTITRTELFTKRFNYVLELAGAMQEFEIDFTARDFEELFTVLSQFQLKI